MNASNQLVGPPYQYDAAGNMTQDASHTYTYDAENRLIKVDGGSTASYTYDAFGRRAEKIVGSRTTDYLYDAVGNVSNEVNNLCAPVCIDTDFLYLGGQLVAEYKEGLTYFVHTDHIGSTRLVTGLNQTVAQNLDYLPFGEHNSTDSGISTHELTGDVRDAESNLDHAQFRQYSSTLGRWMHPDPAGLAAVDPTNPQSWNRYAYVLNNPMALVDPTGLNDCPDDKSTCGDDPGTDTGAPGVDSPTGGDLTDLINLMGNPAATISVTVVAFFTDSISLGDMLNGSWGPGNGGGRGTGNSGGGGNGSGYDWSVFWQGVLHGVRQPGQSFGACFYNNANATTGGTIGKIGAAAAALAPFAAIATTRVANIYQGDPEFPGATMSLNMRLAVPAAIRIGVWAANATGSLAVAAKVANGSFLTMFNGTLALGYAGAVAGGAALGTAIGSAINCR